MAAIIGNRNITLGVMGGTLITAACYGGGEVFGCSPYDAATTAYLKATYPQYWQAIRNFGLDNPQLVPWINEDNDLIVSLVEVGKERWLHKTEKAYIDTQYYPNGNTKVSIDCSTETPYTVPIFGTRNTSTGQTFFILQSGDPGYYCGLEYGGTSRISNRTLSVYRNRQVLTADRFKFYYGDTFVGQTQQKTFTSPLSAYLGYTSQPSYNYPSTMNIFDCKIYDNDILVRHYIPMIHNDAAGMLDLVNLQWYGNANTSGAFTIEMTDTPT